MTKTYLVLRARTQVQTLEKFDLVESYTSGTQTERRDCDQDVDEHDVERERRIEHCRGANIVERVFGFGIRVVRVEFKAFRFSCGTRASRWISRCRKDFES